jgi:hypothetical protein
VSVRVCSVRTVTAEVIRLLINSAFPSLDDIRYAIPIFWKKGEAITLSILIII